MSLKHIITISLALCLFGYINAAPFTIVIDAGHGGHDAGAIGSFSKEKNILLEKVSNSNLNSWLLRVSFNGTLKRKFL